MIRTSNKITVREVNKYLSPLIKELKAKHIKVTNPDFETELIQISGIGWKQVKNYQNHPDPSKQVKDNSKVRKFVLNQRSTDTSFKIKKILLSLVLITILMICILGINNLVHEGLNKSEGRELEKIINQKIEEIRLNNEFVGCKKFKGKSIDCPEGLYNFKEKRPAQ